MRPIIAPMIAVLGSLAVQQVAARDTFTLGVTQKWYCSPGTPIGCSSEWSIGAINRNNGASDTTKETGVARSLWDICGSTLFGARVDCPGDISKRCSDYGVAAYNYNWCRTVCPERGDPPNGLQDGWQGWIGNFFPKNGEAWGVDLICDRNF